MHILKKADRRTKRHTRKQNTVKQVGTAVEHHEGDETSHTMSRHLNPGAAVLSADSLQKLDELVRIFLIISAPIVGKWAKHSAGRRSPMQEWSIDFVPRHGAERCRRDQPVSLLHLPMPLEWQAQVG